MTFNQIWNRCFLFFWTLMVVSEGRWGWRLVDVTFLLLNAAFIAHEDRPRTCGRR